MIDYDVSVAPVGVLGIQRLLDAIEKGHPNDESEWVEFKADLDPNTKDGAAAIAKAIVAFANRDPDHAQRWCGGHAYIVVGLAPGNLAGAPEIDPAVLHDKVNALIASPPPHWDPMPVTYKSKHVIVITVVPPKRGDAIACIGKSSGDVVDGNVYVRVPGKSERAKSADMRRLSARLAPVSETLQGIVVNARGTIASVDYPEEWVTWWIDAEERVLLAPLAPKPEPKPDPLTALRSTSLGLSIEMPAFNKIGPILRAGAGLSSQAERLYDSLNVKHEEERTEEEYRAEVESYLDHCREHLPGALDTIRANEARPVIFSITNNTGRNYTAVEVKLHIEGDVFGYRWVEKFQGWTKYVGARPRLWGPWTEKRASALNLFDGYSRIQMPSSPPQSFVSRPQPRIENGGSVSITCLPVDLRPRQSESLLTVNLVGDRTVAADVRVTWSATATDVDGLLTDQLTVPLADERALLNISSRDGSPG